MARHASAVKAARQAMKRRIHNQQKISGLKTAVRKLRTAATTKYADKDAAKKVLYPMLSDTQRVLMQAVSKNLIKRGKASRTISRLSKQVHAAAS